MSLPRPRRCRIDRGFTLLEAMVAIVVLGILATIALPGAASMLGRHRLQGAAEGFAADLSQARMVAAQSGQTVHVTVQPGEGWCYAVARAPGCRCDVEAACQIRAVRAADWPGVQLAAGNDLSVDPMAAQGAVAQSLAIAQWTSGSRRVQVRQTPLGRAYVCAVSGDGAVPTC